MNKGPRWLLAGPTALVGLAVIVFSILFWGASAPAQNRPVSTKTADIQAGELLFDRFCASCHGFGGLGAKAPELYTAGPAATYFFLSTGRMPLNSPTAEPEPHTPLFNSTQIAQIVAYVNSLGVEHGTPGPGVPEVTPACATETAKCPTLSEGQQLFLENCSQCHDASGAGGELSNGYVIPSLRTATLAQIAEAIRVGPRPMPGFGPGQLTDQQVSAIADYIYHLSHTADPGGLGIAHFGPVPEGFVGVVFGLGVLLVAARLIGNRG